MRQRNTRLVFVLCMGLACLGSGWVHAQDENPFGPSEKDPFGTSGEDPFGPSKAEIIAKEAEVRKKLPQELQGVRARWTCNDDGQFISVEFGAGEDKRLAAARPADLEHLAKLPHLTSVTVDPTTTTDESLKVLGKLTGLKELRLKDSKITGKGVAHLKPLRKLVVLDFSMTAIDDEAMRIVAQFEKLEELDIYGTNVGDFGIAHLYQHEKLRKLTIGGGAKDITDDSIGTLSNIKSLRRLEFAYTSISDAQALQQALPDCELIPPQ